VVEHLGKPTIRKRLADAPHLYPVPPSGAWSLGLVDEILSNPKYTGHQVMGRRRHKGGKRVWTPASEWIWTPEPTHEAIVPKQVWDAAQKMGMRHGSTRDPGAPAKRPGRRYVLRSRLFCSICHRRLSGKARTTTARTLVYYQCPHDPGIRRHAAAHPDHRNVYVREETVLAAITGFYAERVFGPDRAALLAALTPATTAAKAARCTARAKTLRKKLDKIDVAETALITELETPAGPADPPPRPSATASAPASPSSTPNAPPSTPTSPPWTPPQPSPWTTPPCSANCPPSATSSPTPPTSWSNGSWPCSTSAPSTTATSTSSPSAPPSPKPPPKPPATCSPTPAPTTTSQHQTPPLPGQIRLPTRTGPLGRPPGRNCRT
jgi:hypothetical protein